MYCLLARNIIALWCLKVSGKGLTLNTADCYSDKLINCWGCSDEPRWSRPVPNPLNLTVNTVREAERYVPRPLQRLFSFKGRD